jgi:hypothetical protein
MNWFIAKVIFEIQRGEAGARACFDEQYRLIRAAHYEEAFDKAAAIGRQESEVLRGSSVRWSFVNVSELYQVDDLKDGMELFSSTYEAADRNLYRETANLRAAYLRSRFAPALA